MHLAEYCAYCSVADLSNSPLSAIRSTRRCEGQLGPASQHLSTCNGLLVADPLRLEGVAQEGEDPPELQELRSRLRFASLRLAGLAWPFQAPLLASGAADPHGSHEHPSLTVPVSCLLRILATPVNTTSDILVPALRSYQNELLQERMLSEPTSSLSKLMPCFGQRGTWTARGCRVGRSMLAHPVL